MKLKFNFGILIAAVILTAASLLGTFEGANLLTSWVDTLSPTGKRVLSSSSPFFIVVAIVPGLVWRYWQRRKKRTSEHEELES